MNTLLATRPPLQFAMMPLVVESASAATFRQCRDAARTADALVAEVAGKLAPVTVPALAAPSRDSFVHADTLPVVRDYMAADPEPMAIAAWGAIFATPGAIGAAICAGSSGSIVGASLFGALAAAIPVVMTAAVIWRRQVAKYSNQAHDLEERLKSQTLQVQHAKHELATERWRHALSTARREAHGNSITLELLSPLADLLRAQTSSEALNIVARRLGFFAADTLSSHPDDLSPEAKRLFETWLENRATPLASEAWLASTVQVMTVEKLNQSHMKNIAWHLRNLDAEARSSVAEQIHGELFDGPRYRFEGSQPDAERLRVILQGDANQG